MEMERTDIFGHELEEGDTVVTGEPRYHNLVIGTVVGFTPKSVVVEYLTQCHCGGNKVTYKPPKQVVKKI